jgi:hypothetical protein
MRVDCLVDGSLLRVSDCVCFLCMVNVMIVMFGFFWLGDGYSPMPLVGCSYNPNISVDVRI